MVIAIFNRGFISRSEINLKNIYGDFQKIWVMYVNNIFTVIDKDFNKKVLTRDLNLYYLLIKFTFK